MGFCRVSEHWIHREMGAVATVESVPKAQLVGWWESPLPIVVKNQDLVIVGPSKFPVELQNDRCSRVFMDVNLCSWVSWMLVDFQWNFIDSTRFHGFHGIFMEFHGIFMDFQWKLPRWFTFSKFLTPWSPRYRCLRRRASVCQGVIGGITTWVCAKEIQSGIVI